MIYRISGAFFFGAAASIGAVLDRIGEAHRALIVDFSAVPFVDSTAAYTVNGLAKSAAKHGVALYLTGTTPELRRELAAHGIGPAQVNYKATIERATHAVRGRAAAGRA